MVHVFSVYCVYFVKCLFIYFILYFIFYVCVCVHMYIYTEIRKADF